MRGHKLFLYRDEDRLGGRYGMHYYIERVGCDDPDGHMPITVDRFEIDNYDRSFAVNVAKARSSLVGAEFVDRTNLCTYGWSAD